MTAAVFPIPNGSETMTIRKAVITAAGEHHAQLPLQSVVTADGRERTVLQTTIDQIAESGIEEIALVIRPGMRASYLEAAGLTGPELLIIEQDNPRGYGDAILRAEEFLGEESFLHLVSDHLFMSRVATPCARQLIDVAEQHNCCVSAIQPTRENEIGSFGTVGGVPVARESGLYEVSGIIEKPTPTVAEQYLIVPGQRSGYYLCFFGMHVLTPSVLRELRKRRDASGNQPFNLSGALNSLCQSERCLAYSINGTRCNISQKYGLLLAQLAISLHGQDRDLILSELVRLLAIQSH